MNRFQPILLGLLLACLCRPATVTAQKEAEPSTAELIERLRNPATRKNSEWPLAARAPESIPAVVKLLKESKDQETRYSAIVVFADLRTLKGMTQGNPRRGLKEAIATQVAPALIAIANNPADPQKDAAVGVLDQLKDDAAPALAKVTNTANPRLRQLAAEALSAGGSAGVDALIAQLRDPDRARRDAAATGLAAVKPGPDGRIDDEELKARAPAVPLLVNLLLESPERDRYGSPSPAQAALATIGRYAVPGLTAAIAKQTDPQKKVRLVSAFKQIALSNDDAVAPLRPLLADRDEAVRGAAGEAMMTSHAGQAALVEATRDKDANVRLAAVRAIGRGSENKSAPAAVAALLADQDARVRAAAATTLVGGINSGQAARIAGVKPEVVAALVADRDPAARDGGVALARVLGPGVLPVLFKSLASATTADQSDAASRGVVAVMQNLGNTGSSPAAVGPTLTGALKAKEPAVRTAAAKALAYINVLAIVQDLVPLAADADPAVRAAAVAALGHPDVAADVAPVLATALKDKDPIVRLAAARAAAAGLPPDAGALAALVRVATTDPDLTARVAGDDALRRAQLSTVIPTTQNATPGVVGIELEAAVSQLADEAARGGPGATDAAIAAGLLGTDPRVQPVLVAALNHANDDIASAAVRSLGWSALRSRPGVLGLLNAMKSPDPAVAQNAALAVSFVGPQAGPAVEELLRRQLAGTDPKGRAVAAVALSRIAPSASSSVEKAVIDATKDSRARVRTMAVYVLAMSNESTARTAVTRMLDDADPRVARAAAESLLRVNPVSAQGSNWAGVSMSPNVRKTLDALQPVIGTPTAASRAMRAKAVSDAANLPGPDLSLVAPYLIDALLDPDPGLRKAAAQTLKTVVAKLPAPTTRMTPPTRLPFGAASRTQPSTRPTTRPFGASTRPAYPLPVPRSAASR